MCFTSAISDHYGDQWKKFYLYPNTTFTPDQGFKQFFDDAKEEEIRQLKEEVTQLKEMLEHAKKYDVDNNEPDCEMEEKITLLKALGAVLNINLVESLYGKTHDEFEGDWIVVINDHGERFSSKEVAEHYLKLLKLYASRTNTYLGYTLVPFPIPKSNKEIWVAVNQETYQFTAISEQNVYINECINIKVY